MAHDIQKIRDLIGNAKTKRAIEELLSEKTEYNNAIINLRTRLKTLKSKEITGIISNSDANTERNNINFSLLEIVSMIEEDAQKEVVAPANSASSHPSIKTIKKGIEKVLNNRKFKKVDWYRKGIEKAKSVCKVHIAGGYVGTGFLLEGGYLLTNNHNIVSSTEAQYSRIEFGFDGSTESVFYNLDHKDFITSEELDYSRIKIKDNPEQPLSQWGFLTLNPVPPRLDALLAIIQHPDGRSQEIDHDEGCHIWEYRLQYTVNTEPGSSGSPVFDINWDVVAIHHAGEELPIDAAGNTAYTNEGILIDYILKDIEKQVKSKPEKGHERAIDHPIKIDKPIKTLIVYHREDAEYAEEITSHLFTRTRSGDIELFDLQDDITGEEQRKETRQKALKDALMVLVLISNSLYKKDTRKIALSVEKSIGEKTVIPIRVSPFDLNGTPFEKLQGLPLGGKSISEYGNKDVALHETAKSIGTVIDKISK